MPNELLELYKFTQWNKEILREKLKKMYGITDSKILDYYEKMTYLKESALKTELTKEEESILTELDPNLALRVYYNIYKRVLEVVKDNPNVVVLKNSTGYKVLTKNIDGVNLPIFDLQGNIELVDNEEVIKPTDINLYQTEFNAEKRLNYLGEIYKYYQRAFQNGDDVSFYLAKLDELAKRPNLKRESEFDLMSIQIDYRERILHALQINPQEYFNKTIPHIHGEGKILRRSRMHTNLTDDYHLY